MKQAIRVVHKRALTIVELMIAIAIIVMMTTVVGINLRSAAATQRFHDSVQRIVSKLRYAQDLMIIANADAQVIFERRDGITYCQLRLIGEVSELLRRAAGGMEALPEIAWLDFEGGSTWEGANLESEGRVVIEFMALGRRITRGRMGLANIFSSQGGLRRYIALPGYPTHIEASAELPELERIDDEREQQSAELFPYALYEAA